MRWAALALWMALSANVALAETASVIDPTEGLEPPKPPAAAPRSSAQPDTALKRAEAEQRRRAKAQARARTAEKKAAEREIVRLRALEQARQVDAAARDAETRAAARKAAAVQAAIARASAAKAAAARLAAARDAAREAASRELAEREAAARDAALKEEAAARDRQIKRVAAREAPTLKEPAPLGTAFRDCARCPELVWLPQGEFVMGEATAATAPRSVVTIRYKLAVGRFEVTFAEWDACVAAGGCRRRPHDAGWGRGWQPVINVSWADAQQYVGWLSRSTNRRYRLLTEAEWEYAARAGTDVRYWWGDQASRGDANCADCGSKWDGRQAAPVGRFAPNPFGLHDMHGNVSEWVEDCYRERCSGSADTRVVRGGAWYGSSRSTRSTSRTSAASDYSDNGIGFRVARTE